MVKKDIYFYLKTINLMRKLNMKSVLIQRIKSNNNYEYY